MYLTRLESYKMNISLITLFHFCWRAEQLLLDFSKLLIESDFLFGHRNANDTCSWAPRTEIRYQCYYCDRGRDTNAKDDKDIIDDDKKSICRKVDDAQPYFRTYR